MASPSLATASPATPPWMGDTPHPTHPTMAQLQPTSPGLHHKVTCRFSYKFTYEWVSWETPGQLWCSLVAHRAITLECPSTCFPPCDCSCMCENSAVPVHTNLNLDCPLIPSRGFTHFPTSLCICLLSLSSCISGYSPFTSFPSKAVAANPVSDLSSPLDLGNCLLSCSCSFHTPHALQSSNPLCTCKYYSSCHVLFSKYDRRRSFEST